MIILNSDCLWYVWGGVEMNDVIVYFSIEMLSVDFVFDYG